jgi:hypothetical protein
LQPEGRETQPYRAGASTCAGAPSNPLGAMKSEPHIQATMTHLGGGTATHLVPYPLPEAVLVITLAVPDATSERAEGSASSRWDHRVFLLVHGSDDEPEYRQDTRLPDPTYENAWRVPVHCGACELDFPLLFARTYPIQLPATPENGNFFCEAHYRDKYPA